MNAQASPAPTLWEQGREPGRQMAMLGAAVVLTVAAADLLLAGRVGLFFDLCFVALCLYLALQVRPRDFFTVGVLPPLMMLGAFVLVALADPGAIARPGDNLVQAVVSGLTHHSVALTAGYALALGTLAYRRRYLAQHPPGHTAQSPKREASPAP